MALGEALTYGCAPCQVNTRRKRSTGPNSASRLSRGALPPTSPAVTPGASTPPVAGAVTPAATGGNAGRPPSSMPSSQRLEAIKEALSLSVAQYRQARDSSAK